VANGASLRRETVGKATFRTLRHKVLSVQMRAIGNHVAEVGQQSIDRPSIVYHPVPRNTSWSEESQTSYGRNQSSAMPVPRRPICTRLSAITSSSLVPSNASLEQDPLLGHAHPCYPSAPGSPMPTIARLKMLPALPSMHSCLDGCQTQPSCKPANRKAHRFQSMKNQNFLQCV
jgi:hypothetical protein